MNEVVIFGAGIASILHFGIGFLVGAKTQGGKRELSLADPGQLPDPMPVSWHRFSQHLENVDGIVGEVVQRPFPGDDDIRLKLTELLEANRRLQDDLRQTQRQLEAIRDKRSSESSTRTADRARRAVDPELPEQIKARMANTISDAATEGSKSRLVESQHEPLPAPLRRHRRPFRRSQLIAPYDELTIPDGSAFRPVQCWDISADGFSFLFPRVPKFRSVILAIGSEQSPLLLAARITEVSPFQERSREEFQVYCQFTARLDPAEFANLPPYDPTQPPYDLGTEAVGAMNG